MEQLTQGTNDRVEGPVPEPGQAHVCPDCSRTFTSAQGMSTHRSRAHGRKARARRKPVQRVKPGAEGREQPRTAYAFCPHCGEAMPR